MHSYHNPSVPTALTIFEPLQDGSVVEVHGHVRHGHHKDFSVELLSGPNIVLHVNFRFHHEHIVAMNSSFNGMWGPEIRHKNHLHHSEHFDLRIKVHQSHYHITCNGRHLADYPHRYPYQQVQAVGLKGGVHVDKVHFEGFHFRRAWGGQLDLGHSGYSAYGTETYIAPVFIGSAQPFIQGPQQPQPYIQGPQNPPFIQGPRQPQPFVQGPQQPYYPQQPNQYNPYG